MINRMRKNSIIVFSIMILIIIISGCSKPEEDTEAVDLLDLAYDILMKAQEVKDNDDLKLVFAEEGREMETLIGFYEDSRISSIGHQFDTSDQHFVSTADGNTFITLKDIYVTNSKRGDLVFSLDGKEWWGMNDSDKEIRNIIFDYTVDPVLDRENNVLTIQYAGAMKLSDDITLEKIKNDKTLKEISPGMIIGGSDDKEFSLDYDDDILKIRAGTRIYGKSIIESNLISSNESPDSYSFQALRDIFIFRKKNGIGFSFDNENWSINILSFDFSFPEFKIIVEEDSRIYFESYFKVNYKQE